MRLNGLHKSGRDFKIAEQQRRKHVLEDYQSTRAKEKQYAGPCRNLYRAITLASVTLQDLMKGCNSNLDISCGMCDILFRAIKSCIPANELSLNGTISWPSFKWYEPTWTTSGNPDKEEQRVIEIFRTTWDITWQDVTFPRRTFVPESSMAHQSIQQVHRWLLECACSSGNASLLPTRVLNLKDPNIIRLEEPRGLQGRYACLSHCWGQLKLKAKDSFVTTRDSYKTYLKEGIRFECLPKLFQDAVKLAQALDIPYLWIDALCIIQGCDDDWRKEAAKMADVYRNSYVTFAATSARDSHGSCASQLPSRFQPHYIGNGLYSREKIQHIWEKRSNTKNVKKPDQCSTRFPLLERGWVYQERLLAPHVLHLTEHEIIWECSERTICQCKDTAEPHSASEQHPKVDHAMSLLFGGTDVKRRWRTVVEEFSSLSLTLEKDCLPALAGLAKQFQEERCDDDYLAGVWRQSLFEDMLWAPFPGPSRRPQEWRSPTWSWASVQGSVRYLQNTQKDIITFPRLIDAHCDPIGTDPMGELKSGLITIEGQVLVVSSESFGPFQSRLSSAADQIYFWDYYPDLKESPQQDMANKKFSQTMFALRLAHDPHAIPATEYFLVIRAVEPGSSTYERWALARCHDSEMLALMENMYRTMKVNII